MLGIPVLYCITYTQRNKDICWQFIFECLFYTYNIKVVFAEILPSQHLIPLVGKWRKEETKWQIWTYHCSRCFRQNLMHTFKNSNYKRYREILITSFVDFGNSKTRQQIPIIFKLLKIPRSKMFRSRQFCSHRTF